MPSTLATVVRKRPSSTASRKGLRLLPSPHLPYPPRASQKPSHLPQHSPSQPKEDTRLKLSPRNVGRETWAVFLCGGGQGRTWRAPTIEGAELNVAYYTRTHQLLRKELFTPFAAPPGDVAGCLQSQGIGRRSRLPLTAATSLPPPQMSSLWTRVASHSSSGAACCI